MIGFTDILDPWEIRGAINIAASLSPDLSYVEASESSNQIVGAAGSLDIIRAEIHIPINK
jgi:hypothetical protein